MQNCQYDRDEWECRIQRVQALVEWFEYRTLYVRERLCILPQRFDMQQARSASR